MYDNSMKFVESHEWVKIEDDSIVCVGITHHAQELLGDLVYIELPKVGQSIKSHDTVGVVESVKAASDLYSPVSGEVIEINSAVINDPTLANTSAHTDGWLFKVKLDDVMQLNKLLNAEEYKKLIG